MEAAYFGTDINTKGLNSTFILAEQPLFSMPRDLSLVDPLWSGCTPIAGVFDPASILVRASVLVATSSAILTPSTRAMPASSLAHQLASETVANAQPEASSKQQQPPNDGSVDPVLAPAATGASGRAQNPQDPVPSHPGEVEQGDPEEGSGGDSAGGIQEGSTPSNPAQDEKQDPAGGSQEGSGDDTGDTNSN